MSVHIQEPRSQLLTLCLASGSSQSGCVLPQRAQTLIWLTPQPQFTRVNTRRISRLGLLTVCLWLYS